MEKLTDVIKRMTPATPDMSDAEAEAIRVAAAVDGLTTYEVASRLSAAKRAFLNVH